MMDNMLTDIIKEHIVADKKTVNNITLDENKFIVNGKQQPEAVFKKFKEKYIKKPGFSFYYTGNENNYTFRYSNDDEARRKQNFKEDAHK
jgi:hypothetical protein